MNVSQYCRKKQFISGAKARTLPKPLSQKSKTSVFQNPTTSSTSQRLTIEPRKLSFNAFGCTSTDPKYLSLSSCLPWRSPTPLVVTGPAVAIPPKSRGASPWRNLRPNPKAQRRWPTRPSHHPPVTLVSRSQIQTQTQIPNFPPFPMTFVSRPQILIPLLALVSRVSHL